MFSLTLTERDDIELLVDVTLSEYNSKYVA